MTWLVERGIGEDRALLVEGGRVQAARVRWPGELRAGDVVPARLVSRTAGSARGVARTAEGAEILLDKLPRQVSEGAAVSVVLTRAPVSERGRFKRAQGRLAAPGDDGARSDNVFTAGECVRRFPAGLWDEVWEAAWDGTVAFAGGTLVFAVTPAMTLVDVDGDLPARELALRAVPALAEGLRWFELGGSVGVDFPSLPDKADRRAVDTALDAALADWPHERTAMNGFGFVQLVARLEGPSLLHRLAFDRAGAAARRLLRQAEALEGAGAILLAAHPAEITALRPEWLDELARRTGRDIRTQADPALAIGRGHAQIVPR